MNFIEIYDDALKSSECLRLIEEFENHTNIAEGGFTDDNNNFYIDYDKKKDIELSGLRFSDQSDISKILWEPLCRSIETYSRKYECINYINVGKIDDRYNFQKYSSEDDGYKVWHTEHGSGINSSRVLAWMFYLNDAKSGTEFMNFPKVSAKSGRCVIWPAGFTHVHRSEPNVGLKYVITGWISFV